MNLFILTTLCVLFLQTQSVLASEAPVGGSKALRRMSAPTISKTLTPAQLALIKRSKSYSKLGLAMPLASVESPFKIADLVTLYTIDKELKNIGSDIIPAKNLKSFRITQRARLDNVSKMIRDLAFLAKADAQLDLCENRLNEGARAYVLALADALDSSHGKLRLLRKNYSWDALRPQRKRAESLSHLQFELEDNKNPSASLHKEFIN